MRDLVSAVSIPSNQADGIYRLKKLWVQEGALVQPGQVLAHLEDGEQSIELKSTRLGYIVGLHALQDQPLQDGQVLCYVCDQPSAAFENTTGARAELAAVLIFGAGGQGKAVIDLIRTSGSYRIAGLIDDGLPPGSEVLGVPVLGGAALMKSWREQGVSLAVNAVGGIGNVDVRLRVFDQILQAGFTCPTLVHPSAVIEPSAVLEDGLQILAHAYVGSAARVGFGSLLNAGAIVSHDCKIGQVVNLSPGATLAGSVRVDDYTQIGMRATVNVGINVGTRCILGNGCTVKADVPPRTRVWAGTIWPIRTRQ